MPIRKEYDAVTPSLTRLQSDLEKIPRRAYDYWVRITPKDTGNARNRTAFENSNTINANYPYAVRLDRGYSKQAPKGMSEPTKNYVQQLLKQTIRK